ncbi:hypothetical protein LPJ66_006652 [Kickxella alabastrina]|uniref:Uncharacterized protein n=1 Tax=Kickxella alabastrina TaxID=61397 RepID=A0ACC1IB13_9FUNG|nr:hypothetical protein LPJ66_006652 [Kickxella alabastrina]
MDFTEHQDTLQRMKQQEQDLHDKYQHIVGKTFVKKKDLVANGVSLDESKEFSVESLPEAHRILKGDNCMMTMDYRSDRLNVFLDTSGVCTSVNVG